MYRLPKQCDLEEQPPDVLPVLRTHPNHAYSADHGASLRRPAREQLGLVAAEQFVGL